jgi:uncharacterized protein YlxW (UPF0749 family)
MASPAIRIDTLSIAKELEESGIPIKQAEAQTRVYAKVINMVIEDQLATKQDLHKVEQVLRQDLQKVEQVLKQDLQKVEQVLKQDIQKVEQGLLKEINVLDNKINSLDNKVSRLEIDIQTQTLKLTVRLGSLLVVGIAVLAALIKF